MVFKLVERGVSNQVKVDFKRFFDPATIALSTKKLTITKTRLKMLLTFRISNKICAWVY